MEQDDTLKKGLEGRMGAGAWLATGGYRNGERQVKDNPLVHIVFQFIYKNRRRIAHLHDREASRAVLTEEHQQYSPSNSLISKI